MPQPNILLLTVDCFRFDKCGFNGHHRPTTPTLDRLAGESYVFDNAFATGPQTVESFPGIFAGRQSHECSYVEGNIGWKTIPSSAETLSTFMSDQGYETAAILTNPFVTEDQNYHRGFDEFENLKSRRNTSDGRTVSDHNESLLKDFLDPITAFAESRLKQQKSVFNAYMLLFVAYQYRRLITGWPSIHAEDVIDILFDALEKTEAPFFIWTHLMDLHLPIHPNIVDQRTAGGVSRFEHFLAEGANAGDIKGGRYNDIYDGALAYIDAQIGRVIDYLNTNGYRDDTIVIVTADHGEAIYDRGIYGHPVHYMYEELLHVPLLVHTPSRESKRITEQFSLAWLHELFAELIDTDLGDFPSRSGRETHLEGSGDDVIAISDAMSETGQSVVVRNDEFKYITYFGDEKPGGVRNKPLEDTGFRITSDKGERNPLPGNKVPEILREHAERIQTAPSELRPVELDTAPNVKKNLEELGYKM